MAGQKKGVAEQIDVHEQIQMVKEIVANLESQVGGGSSDRMVKIMAKSDAPNLENLGMALATLATVLDEINENAGVISYKVTHLFGELPPVPCEQQNDPESPRSESILSSIHGLLSFARQISGKLEQSRRRLQDGI